MADFRVVVEVNGSSVSGLMVSPSRRNASRE